MSLPQALLLLASAVLSIGVAECAFRALSISHPELSADAIVASQNLPTASDRQALISLVSKMADQAFTDVAVDPDWFEDGLTRVLFLGDSFTQGGGLKDRDDRFSNVLERRVNRELAATQRVDIFNAGVGGSNPIAWVRYLERIGPVYQPDVVFAIFFLRDGTSLPTSLKMNRETIDPIRAKYRSRAAYEWSAVLRLLYNKLAWREYSEQFKRTLTSAYVGTRDETATWRRQREALARIARACELEGTPFYLVIFPMLLNLNDYEFFAVEEEIRRFARGRGIPVFSLTPGFLGKDDRSLWVSPTDQHPNVEGHRIAADTLHPYLVKAITGCCRAPAQQ